MSDFNSSLPIRTENNGDAVVKLVDYTTNTQGLAIDASGRIVVKLDDGSGSAVTSQVNGAQRALDVGINVAGVQVDPRAIRALTAADVVTANQGGTWTVQPGNTQNTVAWLTQDAADGPVAPGAAASKSILTGGQYSSTLPTLTTGQQAAVQVDSSGRLLVSQPTASALNNTATQGPAAAITGAWTVKPTDGTNSQAYLATGEAKVSVTQPLPTGTNTIGKVAQDNTTQWVTSDLADGPVTPGTAATKSILAGVQYSSSLPTLTSGQQAAVQADSAGRLLVGSIFSPLPAGANNIGKVSVQDSSGAAISTSNPLPVVLSSTLPGTLNNKYNTTANLAAAGTANHDYAVTASKTFNGKKFWASASGKIRADVIASPDGTTFTNVIWTSFNSTANPNISIDLDLLTVQDTGAGAKVRIVITNLDKAAMDVYSTISGTEN